MQLYKNEKPTCKVCNTCNKKLSNNYIYTVGVEHEGNSYIRLRNDNGRGFAVDGQQYCSIDCLAIDIKKCLIFGEQK